MKTIVRISIPEEKQKGYTKEWISKLNKRLCYATERKLKESLAYDEEMTLCRRANTVFFGDGGFWVPSSCLIPVRK